MIFWFSSRRYAKFFCYGPLFRIMGKKKAKDLESKEEELTPDSTPKSNEEGEEEEIEDLEDELLGDVEEELEDEKLEELKIDDKSKAPAVPVTVPSPMIPKAAPVKKTSSPMVLTKDDVEKPEEEIEETEKKRDYKHLEINIEEIAKDEYIVYILHQSHGFLNYMVSKLLKIKGVVFAAYKISSIDHPNIYIKIDGTKDIKNILNEVIKIMRIEIGGLKNAIASVKF